MSGESLLFIFAVIAAAILLFIMVYFIIMFSDLEVDYINPIDLCNKLNLVVLPEYGLHALLCVLFVLSFQITCVIINLPLLAYNAKKVMDNKYKFDPTVIFRDLSLHKRDCFIKLGFFMLTFFYYLYRMIIALIGS